MKKNEKIDPKKSKNPIPQAHWEVKKNLTPEGNNSGWGAFLPRKGKDRPTPHVKTNECDY